MKKEEHIPTIYRLVYNRNKIISNDTRNLLSEEVCNSCKRKIKKRYIEVDHIIPVCLGGLINNKIQILCKECHKLKTKRDMRVIGWLKKLGYVIKIGVSEYYICVPLSDLFLIYETLFDCVKDGEEVSYKIKKLIEEGKSNKDYKIETIECNNLDMIEQRCKEVDGKRLKILETFLENFYTRSVDSFISFSTFYLHLLIYLKKEDIRKVSKVELGKLLNRIGIEKRFTTINNKTQLYIVGLKRG